MKTKSNSQFDQVEKLTLKKKIGGKNATTWQERLGKALQQRSKTNVRFTEKEVAEDVRKAVAAVRTDAKN